MNQLNTNRIEDRCGIRCIHKDRVDAARRDLLPEQELYSMAALFKSMADPSRLKIIRALDKGEMCVCDLAALVDCSESAVSHQLRLLRQMELVSNRRQGQVLYYRLNDDHVHALIAIALEHIRE
jgi:ArsR family transcriptional regulator, lead/cadmium/zinc/bismuth-responsive transcriptional repressor